MINLKHTQYKVTSGRIEFLHLEGGIMPRQIFSRRSDVKRVMKLRDPYSSKRDFGYLLIVGGSDVYSGAPALAGMAGLRTGAGMVFIAAPKGVTGTIRSYSPNLIVHSLSDDVITVDDTQKIVELLARADAIVLGPGIGLNLKTQTAISEIVKAVKGTNKPMLIDADAIRALHGRMETLSKTKTVITPHAGEFEAISGIKIPPHWKERVPVCVEFTKKNPCVLLMKGHDTVITDGDRVRVNNTGNPGMATAGAGDVLSGIIGAFLAQGVDPFFAAVAGAYVHGLAGDHAYKEKGCHLVASDLIDMLPIVLKKYDNKK
jgi:NAD(P)H-hydrate epimerase